MCLSGDGISDATEGMDDADGDGVPNYLDADRSVYTRVREVAAEDGGEGDVGCQVMSSQPHVLLFKLTQLDVHVLGHAHLIMCVCVCVGGWVGGFIFCAISNTRVYTTCPNQGSWATHCH